MEMREDLWPGAHPPGIKPPPIAPAIGGGLFHRRFTSEPAALRIGKRTPLPQAPWFSHPVAGTGGEPIHS